MPIEQINDMTDRVPHTEHRNRLRGHLEMLASASLIAEMMAEEEASLERPVADRIRQQGDLTSNFFAKASDELGPDASEDEVWAEVFQDQLAYLQDPFSNENMAYTVAGNMLVTNMFAVMGKSPEEAKAALDYRMWQVARSGEGMKLLAMASLNKDLCVATGDPKTPYRSISEQTAEYGPLFAASATYGEHVRPASIPVALLETTTMPNRAWFFAKAVRERNQGLIQTNRQFIQEGDAQEIFRSCMQSFGGTLDDFNNAGIGEPVTHLQYAEMLMDEGRNPFYLMDTVAMGADDQQALFKLAIDKGGPSQVAMMLHSKKLNKLDESCLQTAINAGAFQLNPHLPLAAFSNLPTGAYDKLQAAGSNQAQIVEGLDAFSDDDRRKVYDELLASDDKRHLVFSNPEKFDFIPRQELIEQAKKHEFLWTIANNIEKWTDGSDTQLIETLLDDASCASTISQKLEKLPALDLQWLVSALDEWESYTALVECIGRVPELDQDKLFDDIIASGDGGILFEYELKRFTQLDTEVVLQKLYASGYYDAIANNVDYFTGQTADTLAPRLLATPEGRSAIGNHLEQFTSVDRQQFTEALLADKNYYFVSINADLLVEGGVDSEWLYQQIRQDSEGLLVFVTGFNTLQTRQAIGIERLFADCLAMQDLEMLSGCMEVFDQPEMKQRFLQLCIDQRNTTALVHGLHYLKLDRLQIAEKCIRAGWEEPTALYWDKSNFLYDAEPDEVPDTAQLLAWGAAGTLLANLNRYPDTPVEQACTTLLQGNQDALLAKIVIKMKDATLPSAVARRLAESGDAWVVRHKKELFDPSAFTPEVLEICSEHDDEFFLELYAYSGQHIDWIDKGIRDFGPQAMPALLRVSREINRDSHDPLPPELRELGVERRGNVGIDQLRAANAMIRRLLVESAADRDATEKFVTLTTTNPLAAKIAKSLTRFEVSEWGEHGADEWAKMLHNHLSTQPGHAPLRPEFVPSEEYTIRSIDAKEFDPSRIDKDARDRFAALKADIEAAFAVAERPARGRYAGLFMEAKTVLGNEIDLLQESRKKFVEKGNNMALHGVDRRIAEVTSLSRLSAREFMETFRGDFSRFTNLKVPALDSLIRTGVFARAIQKFPKARELGQSIISSEADATSFAQTTSFVEQVVNKEVYGQYFDNQKAHRAFVNMSDTAALKNQLAKIQAGRSSGTSQLQIIPSRGLLLELSGHIGDACWASKYDSIAQEFPNITALTFVRNPGRPTERIVGATLAIDTMDAQTGEPVTVIRGINPIENYINGVKVEDVMGAVVDYARKVSEGRKLAVVIDEASGDAATNRPVVQDYLTKHTRPNGTIGKPLRLTPDSTFNSYVLSANQHPAYQVAR